MSALLDSFEAMANEILEEQIAICEIPAPTDQEQVRAQYIQRELASIGLQVRSDDVGNVIAQHPGAGDNPIVLSAHLDTVFGPEQPVTVARPGERNPYRHSEIVPEHEFHAPGISDAAAGLVAILTIARTLRASPAAEHVLYLATVGEEGRGDLRGARHFFESELGRSARAFITIDHSDPAAIVNSGIGSRRYNVQYRSSGGHSWAHFGRYNPAFALAAAADRWPTFACHAVRARRTTWASSREVRPSTRFQNWRRWTSTCAVSRRVNSTSSTEICRRSSDTATIASINVGARERGSRW